jgi:hypothetical protein
MRNLHLALGLSSTAMRAEYEYSYEMKTRGGDGFSRVRDASAKGQKRHKRQQKQKQKRKHHKSSTTQQLPRVAIPARDTHAVPEQHKYDHATITGEEKRYVLCGSSSHSLSDVVALKGSIGDNFNG